MENEYKIVFGKQEKLYLLRGLLVIGAFVCLLFPLMQATDNYYDNSDKILVDALELLFVSLLFYMITFFVVLFLGWLSSKLFFDAIKGGEKHERKSN